MFASANAKEYAVSGRLVSTEQTNLENINIYSSKSLVGDFSPTKLTKESKPIGKTDALGFFTVKVADSVFSLVFKSDKIFTKQVNLFLYENMYVELPVLLDKRSKKEREEALKPDKSKPKTKKKKGKDKTKLSASEYEVIAREGLAGVVEFSSGSDPKTMSRASSEGGDGIDMSGFSALVVFEDAPIGSSSALVPESEGEGREWESAPTQSNLSGKLTAGDINDFSKWVMWNDISAGELKEFVADWAVEPIERFTLQLESSQGSPLPDVKAVLLRNGEEIWHSRTDNTGKAEFWDNVYSSNNKKSGTYSIRFEYQDDTFTIEQAKRFSEGINFKKIQTECNYPMNLDISFVVDATGSMGDEIDYLKAEMTNIIEKVKDSLPSLDISLSSVFYKDYTDDYIVVSKDFTNEISDVAKFISTQGAGGGGDFPEAVDAALDRAVNGLSWRESAVARIVFLVLDAPPHKDSASVAKIRKAVEMASAKGIRIVPLTCSGVDKSTEYLMRSIALLSNGVYLFLTDDSGIGGSHIAPTTDNYSVRLLNNLLFRTIYQFTYLPPCLAEKSDLADTLVVFDPSTDKNVNKDIIPSNEQNIEDKPFDREDLIGWKYYPNPTSGILNIEVRGDIKELFVCDVSGKIIYRIENSSQRQITINLSDYPNGIYFIRYEYAPNEWVSGKFVIAK